MWVPTCASLHPHRKKNSTFRTIQSIRCTSYFWLSRPCDLARLTIAPHGSSNVFKDLRSCSWPGRRIYPTNRSVTELKLSLQPTTLHPLSVSFIFSRKTTDFRVMPETSSPMFASLKSAQRAVLKSQTAPSSPFRGKDEHIGMEKMVNSIFKNFS